MNRLLSCLFIFMVVAPVSVAVNKSILTIEVTKPIVATKKYDYVGTNLIDNNYRTAWCTNRSFGKPILIKVKFNKNRNISALGIVNGYARTKHTFIKNERAKQIVIDFDDKFVAKKVLSDDLRMQILDFDSHEISGFSVLINSTYLGKKYRDICITEIITDANFIDGYRMLFSRNAKGYSRALTENEINRSIKPFFLKYQSQSTFWDILKFASSRFDENSLRLLLNTRYVAKNSTNTVYSATSESLRDMIVGYIENNPRVVYKVFNDKKQLMRDGIVSAYVSYIDPFGNEQLEIMYKEKPGFRKLAELIQSNVKN